MIDRIPVYYAIKCIKDLTNVAVRDGFNGVKHDEKSVSTSLPRYDNGQSMAGANLDLMLRSHDFR